MRTLGTVTIKCDIRYTGTSLNSVSSMENHEADWANSRNAVSENQRRKMRLLAKPQTMRSDNLVLNSIENVKPGSLLSSMCVFPESNGTKFWSHSFHLQNSGILRTRMDQRDGPHENEFWHFSNTKINITNNQSLKSR